MTRFVSGPATGIVLDLRRSPLFLRVVQSPDGSWDALDQPDDSPGDTESITVYHRTEKPAWIHVYFSDGGVRKGRWIVSVRYEVHEVQPADGVLRDRTAWRSFCIEEAKKQHEHSV